MWTVGEANRHDVLIAMPYILFPCAKRTTILDFVGAVTLYLRQGLHLIAKLRQQEPQYIK
jgi:hypothetical protein